MLLNKGHHWYQFSTNTIQGIEVIVTKLYYTIQIHAYLEGEAEGELERKNYARMKNVNLGETSDLLYFDCVQALAVKSLLILDLSRYL